MSLTRYETDGSSSRRVFKYRYGIICLNANGISSLVGGRVWRNVYRTHSSTLPDSSIYTTAYTVGM